MKRRPKWETSQPTSQPTMSKSPYRIRYTVNGSTVEIRCYTLIGAEREAEYYRSRGYLAEVVRHAT